MTGAHFNSLVTMSLTLTGHVKIIRGACYIAIQIAGAMLGASIMRHSISTDDAISSQLGTCNPGPLLYHEALRIETMCCLMFVFVIHGTAFNQRQSKLYGPVIPAFLVGATVCMILYSSQGLSVTPYTGAGAFPNMCFGNKNILMYDPW